MHVKKHLLRNKDLLNLYRKYIISYQFYESVTKTSR